MCCYFPLVLPVFILIKHTLKCLPRKAEPYQQEPRLSIVADKPLPQNPKLCQNTSPLSQRKLLHPDPPAVLPPPCFSVSELTTTRPSKRPLLIVLFLSAPIQGFYSHTLDCCLRALSTEATLPGFFTKYSRRQYLHLFPKSNQAYIPIKLIDTRFHTFLFNKGKCFLKANKPLMCECSERSLKLKWQWQSVLAQVSKLCEAKRRKQILQQHCKIIKIIKIIIIKANRRKH